MSRSKIEWTEDTWNPITGCSKISDGCANCYAERMAKRLKAMGNHRYLKGFDVMIHRDLFKVPLQLKKPRVIFVCSMSDIFHEEVEDKDILSLFEVMKQAHWHTFQVLTKRANRLESILSMVDVPDNVWIGVTVENWKTKNRIEFLRNIEAKTRFVSFEPLIDTVGQIDLTGISWAIVGGESGPGSRPIKEEWIQDIKDQCENSGTLFYFKQWGGFNKKKNGRMLNGRTYDDMPLINSVGSN